MAKRCGRGRVERGLFGQVLAGDQELVRVSLLALRVARKHLWVPKTPSAAQNPSRGPPISKMKSTSHSLRNHLAAPGFHLPSIRRAPELELRTTESLAGFFIAYFNPTSFSPRNPSADAVRRTSLRPVRLHECQRGKTVSRVSENRPKSGQKNNVQTAINPVDATGF